MQSLKWTCVYYKYLREIDIQGNLDDKLYLNETKVLTSFTDI